MLKRAIDFDQLRQELSGHIAERPRERCHLDHPALALGRLASGSALPFVLLVPFMVKSPSVLFLAQWSANELSSASGMRVDFQEFREHVTVAIGRIDQMQGA